MNSTSLSALLKKIYPPDEFPLVLAGGSLIPWSLSVDPKRVKLTPMRDGYVKLESA